MADDLRTRIAKAIYNSSDDYSRKLMVRPDCPGTSEMEGDGKPVCYVWADAVIAELRPQLVAWARMCVDGGDMTPAAQRMLHKIIGADRELRRIKAQQAAAFHRRGSNLLKGDDEQT